MDILHHLKDTLCKSKFKFTTLPFPLLSPSLLTTSSSTQCSKGHLGIIHNSFLNPDILTTNSMNVSLKYDSPFSRPAYHHRVMWYSSFLTACLQYPFLMMYSSVARIIVLKHKSALLKIPQWFSIPYKIYLCPPWHGYCLLLCFTCDSLPQAAHMFWPWEIIFRYFKHNMPEKEFIIFTSSDPLFCLRNVTTTRQKPGRYTRFWFSRPKST